MSVLRLDQHSEDPPMHRQDEARSEIIRLLTRLLAFHDRDVPASDIAAALPTQGAPAGLREVTATLTHYGLRCRMVRLTSSDLRFLPAGTVLEARTGALEILVGNKRNCLEVINDVGFSAKLKYSQLDERFTGIALITGKTQSHLEPGGDRVSLAGFVRKILGSARLLGPILAMSVIIHGVAVALPVMTAAIVDKVVPRSDWHLLIVIAAGFVPLIGIHLAAAHHRTILVTELRSHVDCRMHVGFMHHLLALPLPFLQRLSAGDLVARISSHNQIRESLTDTVIAVLLDAVVASLYLVALFATNPLLAAVTTFLAGIQVLILLLIRKPRAMYWLAKYYTQRRCQVLEHEIVSGIETIRAGAYESAILQIWENSFTRLLNMQIARWKRDAFAQAVLLSLRLLSPVAVLITGAALVLSGQLSLGSMLALSSLATGFLLPFSSLVSTVLTLQVLHPTVERVRDVLETPPEQDAGSSPMSRTLQGRVHLNSVAVEIDGRRILNDVNLRVEAGEFIAIVGRSGHGKSTLLKVIMGLVPPSSGQVLLDGQDVIRTDLGSLRAQMGAVMQTPALFSLSIRDNIALSDPTLPSDQIIEAAKLAAIHDEIMALPHGYETLLGSDNGAVFLSGGQKQRLALARALARRPPILVLDEATSAVDSITESGIHRTLDRLRCTRFVVAHRLSTVRNAHKIVVLRDGCIVESGTHDELLAASGYYAELVRSQIAQAPPP